MPGDGHRVTPLPPAFTSKYDKSSSSRIRNRLFMRLGISVIEKSCDGGDGDKSRRRKAIRSKRVDATPRSPTSTVAASVVEVEHDDACNNSMSKRNQSSFYPSSVLFKSTRQINGVTFNERVKVMEIPSRLDYSERARNMIWCNQHEMETNVHRNAFEFYFEGSDWRKVVEENEMVMRRNNLSGAKELTHPCHIYSPLPVRSQPAKTDDGGIRIAI